MSHHGREKDHSSIRRLQLKLSSSASSDRKTFGDGMSDERAQVKGLLATTAAAAAVAGLALLQKKRAPLYASKQQQQKKKQEKKPVATQRHGHSHHATSAVDYADGYELFPIDFGMHVEHREKLLDAFRAAHPQASSAERPAALLLHGGAEVDRYDTDTQYAFHQESFFQYLFGVREPDCAGFLDLNSGKTVLLVPRLSAEWELWCGERKPLAYFKEHYRVDEVHYVDELPMVLSSRFGVQKLFVLKGTNTDSGLETTTTSTFEGIDKFAVDDKALHPVLVECRVIKSERELQLLRFVNELSSRAHIEVMKSVKPGKMEFHAESLFLHYCYSNGGARFQAYTCICGSGHNASALHYGHAGAPNDKLLEDGDIFLNDMGGELHGYCADITCTIPVNGVFSTDQRIIYEGVLKSHDAVVAAIKPGISYVDMHLLSHRVLTEHLLKHGLFQNGTVDELMEHEISAYFYPHGLGHLMGLDVHDVGGFPQGHVRSTKKILQKLRCVRTLKKNMVLTVEPGCYFIEAQIHEVLSNPVTAKYINQKVLARFRGTGGVRIESDIAVTATGAECMTKVPRTVQEIETVMRTKKW